MLAAFAFAISPMMIERLTGRLVLSGRITAVSLALDCFLLMLSAAALLQGRARKIAFYVIAWIFPIVVLAGLELLAVAIRLSDRVAPIEDTSTLKDWNRWPAYFLSAGSWAKPSGDVKVHRPFHSDGISINALGLRTVLPTAKSPDEWRIAVVGGSTTWGYGVLDIHTIPMQMQNVLRHRDPKISVYNFGIAAARNKNELALLKQFRAVYGIDQVVFYTGGNDVIGSYLSQASQARGLGWLTSHATTFELIKATERLIAVSHELSSQQLDYLDTTVLATLLRENSLREGIRAANTYCEREQMRCDFILQPLIFTRDPPRGSEVRMLQNLDRLYPRTRDRGKTDVCGCIGGGHRRSHPRFFWGAQRRRATILHRHDSPQ